MKLKIYSILVIGFCLMTTFGCKAASQNAVKASGEGSFAKQILYYTNQFRADHGLSPLSLNSFISNEASIHSRDMASGRVGFGHQGFQQRTNHLRQKFGSIATGENVAYGQLSAKEVVDIWINSPPHRKNLLGNYNQIGIGIAEGRDGILFFTQLFARIK